MIQIFDLFSVFICCPLCIHGAICTVAASISGGEDPNIQTASCTQDPGPKPKSNDSCSVCFREFKIGTSFWLLLLLFRLLFIGMLFINKAHVFKVFHFYWDGPLGS